LLRAFVPATQQDDQNTRTLDEVKPVTGPMVDPRLPDTGAHLLYVTEIAQRQASQTDIDASGGGSIPERRNPATERFTFGDFIHAENVTHKLRYVTHGLQPSR
jgi:hypothetical protein